MDVGASFIVDARAPEAMKPAQHSFDHPAPASQALAAVHAPACNAWADAALAQPLAMNRIVVALVGVQFGRSLVRGRPLSPRTDGSAWTKGRSSRESCTLAADSWATQGRPR